MTLLASLHQHITSWQLDGQQVLVRADFNVPHDEQHITDPFRLEAIFPTLNLLLRKKSIIHIITHLDNPRIADISYATDVLAAWFAQAGYAPPQVHIHENLRFSLQEKQQSIEFAHTLARGMHFYVDDAFGSVHRADTSLTLLPRCFPKDRRSIGMLVERELQTLSRVQQAPMRPYIFLLGGGKIHDKLLYVLHLLDYADHIMLCPGLSSIFIPEQAHRYDQSLFSLRDTILRTARREQLLLPQDYLVEDQNGESSYRYVRANDITENHLPIAVGPETVHMWESYITAAQTIVCNGPMGFHDQPETQETLKILLDCIVHSSAYTVAGGGDMLSRLKAFNLREKFTFCSTGGGSMLTLLAHQPLPALEALDASMLDGRHE
jgi:phosphoglycerate kinase